MYDYILERAGENINIDDMARAGLEDYDISKFAPDVPNAKAGPLRIVKPADKRGTTEGVPKGLLRIARNTAPMWASLPLGATVFGQSAHSAVVNPNADTIETALWDAANLGADVLSLVPIPMISAGAEGAQKILGITQAARQGQKFVQQQGLKPQPSAPRPTAIPQAQTRQRTATAARTQGQVMPKAKPMNLANEGQYFIVNPIRSAFGSIFGNKREI